MRPVPCVLLLTSMAACGGGTAAKDCGPAPAADHQAKVRDVVERMLGKAHRLDGPSAYRFGEPVADRVARWHFAPETSGQSQEFGYVHGWSVAFRVTPRYVGYPEQPESQRMAFFAEGQLRGIFSAGQRSAPLDLDKWAPCWVDVGWQPAGRAQPPR